MSDRSLLLLWDEVREKTLRLLQGVTDEEALWSPPGLHNHILWHAGHSYVLVESLIMEGGGDKPVIPDGWFDIFSWKSEPAHVPSDRWPLLSEVVAQLTHQNLRLRHVIGLLNEKQLSGPMPGNVNRTVRYAIVHGLHDEACHSGEIWLLRKLIRASLAALPGTPIGETMASPDFSPHEGNRRQCATGPQEQCLPQPTRAAQLALSSGAPQ